MCMPLVGKCDIGIFTILDLELDAIKKILDLNEIERKEGIVYHTGKIYAGDLTYNVVCCQSLDYSNLPAQSTTEKMIKHWDPKFVIAVGIAGMVTVTFGIVVVYTQNTLQVESVSQYDKVEMQKKYASEQLKLIDIIENPVLRIDVMNQGTDAIIIKKLFIDGNPDESYVIYDTNTLESLTDIPQSKIIAIEPAIQGTSITIITENNKKFSFE